MKKSTAFGLVLVFLVCVSFAGSSLYLPAVHSPRVPNLRQGTSSNWAGYAIETNLSSPQSGAVSYVQGSWVVPLVDCSVASTAYSSFWIGIDGYSSATVEQTGTDSDCSSGSPRYYAWYEMYPKFPVNLKMKITPGDVMTAEIRYLGQGRFQLTIVDTTTGSSFSTIQKSTRARRSSAEWVAEAPSSSGGVLPLADFGTSFFTGAQATLNGHTGAISDSAWQNDAIDMVTSNGTLKAQTSALSADGTGFSVIRYHA